MENVRGTDIDKLKELTYNAIEDYQYFKMGIKKDRRTKKGKKVVTMNFENIIFGYYLYMLILGFLVAFIFRPYFYRHKNLRRIILILNLFNIILYIIIIVISIQEKINPTYILKTMWNGVMYGTDKKAY